MRKINLKIISLVLIIFLAAFLRLYQISSYMQFLGDEGRDVIIAKDILHGEFTLLGPRSSAGDFFMGPFYYYLIAPFLFLSGFDPVGPAIMVALFGTATVILIYFTGKKFFNDSAGLFAAALYSVSPLVLFYSHSSWNPNILPFFSLLLMLFVYTTATGLKSWKHYLFIGILLGICLQLHYLSLFLAVIIFFYLFFMEWINEKKLIITSLLKKYLSIALGVFISLSPFVLFEFRHNFLNSRGILKFIFGETVVHVNSIETNFFDTVGQVFFRIFSRLLLNFPPSDNFMHYSAFQLNLWSIVSLILALTALWALYQSRNKAVSLLLTLWLFFGCLLFGFYKKEIYDYLFTFIFVLPFLLVGNLLSFPFIYLSKKWFPKPFGNTEFLREKSVFLLKFFSLLIFLSLFFFNLSDNPFKKEPNNQRDQVKKIARFVISKSENKPFNFAVLSTGNGDYAYQYFFDILGRKPIEIENMEKDPQRNSVTAQLFIVCEDINCKPLGNSLWQVAGFGRAEITDVWNVSVVKVYRLEHFR